MPPPLPRDTVAVEAAGTTRVDLLFVEQEGILYVVPAADRTHWASAALRAGSARVYRGGGSPEVRAAYLVVRPERVAEIQRMFRAKYGPRVWERYFSRRQRILALDASRPGAPRTPDELIREEFDTIAPFYGEKIETDPFEALLRRRSRARLMRLFAGRDPILELGCGVGVETVPLLREGHRLVAVDISPAMLQRLEARARDAGVSGGLTTIEGSLGELHRLLARFPDGYFSGGFSTFGALNLEPDLNQLPVQLARVLVPGSPFLGVVLNHLALVPKLYEAGLRGPSGLFVRLRGRVPAEGIRFPLDIYQLNPYRWAREFRPFFSVETVTAAASFAPPFESPRLLRLVSGAPARRLERWDAWLSDTWLGPWLGEWAIVVLRRTAEPAPPSARAPGSP
ncbi:MAG: class I SAM-dependent methyltransferase [Thermoplasmata archaeon]|nr:class I SAM-dependent methyltransferase [Thermoplasmata archaeon]